MPLYAVLDGGQIVARRQIDNFSAYPEHKRAANDERGDGGPVLRIIETEGDGPIEQTIIEANRVRIVRSISAPTVDDVAAERQRRLALGFDYNFGDARGVHHIGTTEADMKGWDEVSKYAGALIDLGQIDAQIAIATNTGACTVTPPEWRVIEIASAAFRQPLWAKSFALMAMSPIPASYADDQYWT